MPNERGDVAVDVLAHRLEPVFDAGFHHRDIEIGELGREGGRIREIGFGQAQDGVDIAHKRSDEGALDKPGARRRIGHGGNDEHLVRIRHHDALIRVSVIGRAAEDGGALFQLHNARQGVLLAGGIAHDAHAVAHLDGGAAQLTGAHGGDPRAVV